MVAHDERAYVTRRRQPLQHIQLLLERKRERVVHGLESELDVCADLTDKVLAEDLDWVRGVVAREIRRQLRLPEDRRSTAERRRVRVFALRERRLTIRQIAEQLGVSVGIVHRDLKQAADVRPKVAQLPFKKSVQNGAAEPASPKEAPAELNAESEQPLARVASFRRSS